MSEYTKLVKELRGCKDIDYCTDCPRMANGYVEFCNIKEDAAAAIEELQAEVEERTRVNMELLEDLPKYGEQIAHWVSVEERLPEKNGAYLVFMGYGHNWIWFKDIFMDGKFMADTCALKGAKVDYWMPLPEPPMEVQDG